ncbi:MAG: hypothetical protein NTV86_10495 [Planctomycetota bacterium]|nr:hypothetical protein [Planctomycetota bacterium]
MPTQRIALAQIDLGMGEALAIENLGGRVDPPNRFDESNPGRRCTTPARKHDPAWLEMRHRTGPILIGRTIEGQRQGQ